MNVEKDDDGSEKSKDERDAKIDGGQLQKEGNTENSTSNGDDEDNTDIQLSSSSSGDNEDPKVEESDELLTLRSWVRELRWVVRAEGLGQDDKFPQRNITAASSKHPNNLSLKRCDSENVTEERLMVLQGMQENEGFPLEPYAPAADGNKKRVPTPRPAFQKWLDDLQHYRAKHSSHECNVPLKYTEYPGLGNFVNRQRTEYRKLIQGKASSMTQSKIRQLDEVAFVWSIREGGHASWESRLNDLKDYLDQYGHTNVPKNYPPNPSLGYWVNEQRFQYRRMIKGKSSYMNENKVAQLNAINFKWSLRESKRPWQEWLEELRQYKAEHGNVNVPLKYDRNIPLGSFVNNQRSEYRRYKSGSGRTSMTEAKVRDLERIGFMWNVRDSRTPWAVRLGELKEYKKR